MDYNLKSEEEKREIIRVEDLKRDFIVGGEKVHALRGVSFTIHEGEFVTIMGTSGSGKSTLLNLLGCLDTPTRGDYLLDGVSVALNEQKQTGIHSQPQRLDSFSKTIIFSLRPQPSKTSNYPCSTTQCIRKRATEPCSKRPLRLSVS